jgi:hypothetical protein
MSPESSGGDCWGAGGCACGESHGCGELIRHGSPGRLPQARPDNWGRSRHGCGMLPRMSHRPGRDVAASRLRTWNPSSTMAIASQRSSQAAGNEDGQSLGGELARRRNSVLTSQVGRLSLTALRLSPHCHQSTGSRSRPNAPYRRVIALARGVFVESRR